MTMRRAGWLAAGLVALYLVLQLAGLKQVGLTDDDDFYIPAGIEYAKWLGRVVRFDRGAFTQQAIEAAFSPNHEHPPLAKYVFGVCHFAFGAWLGPTDSARVGTVLFSTLTAALLMVLALFHLGPRRGLFAGVVGVLLLLALPRFYFHSHAATLDVPVAAMYLLAATCALLAERRGWAAWVAGVTFGLASATKLNGPFLIAPYLVFALVVRRGTGGPRARGLVSLPRLPFALFPMAVVGPLVFLALWPWMWFDLFPRVGQYVGFHLHHYGIYFLYFGTIYDKDPFAPWHAPFTMAAITVPVATSLLAAFGLWLGRTAIWSRIARPTAYGEGYRREGDLLLYSVLNAAVAILVVALSGGPKYGGAKLFMPFFPFWCLLAGYGALRLYEAAQEALPRPWARVVPITATALAVVASAGLQLRFGGYALSEYNALAGGLRGATATGFERQYYDIAFRDLVAWLNEHAPKNARVHFLPNNWEYVRTYKWYRQGGELRDDIQVTQAPGQAQLIIVTHERRFARYGNDLLQHRKYEVLEEKVVDSVPIWSVLKVR
ncbi:MAG: glycosyltransferase family 39 protein [Deltaproteobacteria bacterium]|nr:glycosyltransferase family 39 protein [Deltaproteobacteria bacterium]